MNNNTIASESYSSVMPISLGAAISAALFGISYCLYKSYNYWCSISSNSRESEPLITKRDFTQQTDFENVNEDYNSFSTTAQMQGSLSRLQAQVESQHHAIETVSQVLLSQGLKLGEMIAQQTQDEFGERVSPALQIRILEEATTESLSAATTVLDVLEASNYSREILQEQRTSFIQNFRSDVLGGEIYNYPEGHSSEGYFSTHSSLN